MSKNTHSNVKYQQTNANREMSEILPCLLLNITISAQMQATAWYVKKQEFFCSFLGTVSPLVSIKSVSGSDLAVLLKVSDPSNT